MHLPIRTPRRAVLITVLAVTVCSISRAASAHITVAPGAFAPGTTALAAFRIGHGCTGSPATTALRVEMPAGVQSVRPQAKPGWVIRVEPATDSRVAAVIWTGRLPADQFDDFPVMLRLPEAGTVLYFPSVQTCGPVSEQWTQIPDAGESAGALKHPAPSLRLAPADAPEAGHNHEGP